MKLKKWVIAVLSCVTIFAIGVGFAACKREEKSGGISTQQSGNVTPPVINPSQDGQLPSNPENQKPTDQKPSEGLEYTLSEDETYYSVTGIGTCMDTTLVIPSTYKDLPVTNIGWSAFGGCESLTKVVILNGVTSISDSAFAYCSSLTSVVIGNSVTSIGYRAFFECNSLTEISVDGNNTAYQSIDGNLYSKNGTVLVQYAIGKQATSFTIPTSVTHIGDDAFYACGSLTKIVIPDGVVSIDNCAFSSCGSLTEIVIPDSVKSVGGYAFFNCGNLGSVVIGNSVISIDEYTFYACGSLTEIVIPNVVVSIDNRAFSNCSSLTKIKFEGTVEEWNAISKGVNWNSGVSATEVVCSDGRVAL